MIGLVFADARREGVDPGDFVAVVLLHHLRHAAHESLLRLFRRLGGLLHLRPLGRIRQPLHRFAGNIIAVCSRLLLGRAAAARRGLRVGLRRLVALRGAARHFRIIGRFFLPIARHILLVLRLLALIFGQLPLIFRLRLLPLRFFIGLLLSDALLLSFVGLLPRDALLLGLGFLPRFFLHLLLPCVDLRAAALHLGRARQNGVTDEVIDGMMNGYKDIAVVYSGDATVILDENEDMSFYMPNQGTNIWCDAMVIPKNAENPKLANEFINYMLTYEAAFDNTETVGYTSPNAEVFEEMTTSEDLYAENAAYLPRSGYEADEMFHDNQVLMRELSKLWIKVKAAK